MLKDKARYLMVPGYNSTGPKLNLPDDTTLPPDQRKKGGVSGVPGGASGGGGGASAGSIAARDGASDGRGGEVNAGVYGWRLCTLLPVASFLATACMLLRLSD